MRTSPRTGALMPLFGFSKFPSPVTLPHVAFWRSPTGIIVSSEKADLQLPGTEGKKVGPTWQLSVSVREWDVRRSRRPTNDEMNLVIKAFDVPAAWDEDNHFPGVTRTLFIPVDPRHRTGCDCKLAEEVIVEGDGYAWTNPRQDGTSPCRGCELVAFHIVQGRRDPGRCPIHG